MGSAGGGLDDEHIGGPTGRVGGGRRDGPASSVARAPSDGRVNAGRGTGRGAGGERGSGVGDDRGGDEGGRSSSTGSGAGGLSAEGCPVPETGPSRGSTGRGSNCAVPTGSSWMFLSSRSLTKSYWEYEAPIRFLEYSWLSAAALVDAPERCTCSRSCWLLRVLTELDDP